MDGKRILLLGAYSMEVVECGGVLCKNARAGGVSHAAILFAGEQMRRDLSRCADILGVSLEFLDMDAGTVLPTREEKLRLVETIRRFRPDIILTQDPDHCAGDLDPGRRPVMSLVLEAVALAGRPYALDELSGLEPCPCPAIYYITPDHPNCLVDIQDVWVEKCAAMDALETQLIHFGGPCSPEEEALRARLGLGGAVHTSGAGPGLEAGHGSGLLPVPRRHRPPPHHPGGAVPPGGLLRAGPAPGMTKHNLGGFL